MIRSYRSATATAALLMTVAATAGVAHAQDEPPVSPLQLCAATDITQVDALLAGVAESDLVGALAPLVDLTVPKDPGGLTLDADVNLTQVREALACPADVDSTPTVTPTPTAEPTATAPSTTETPTPSTDTGDDFDQLDDVPSLPAQTGGGPA